ncbi:MAG: hypothetical protein E6J41_10585 [Chloroflexi bacterium]|nr:MAG: hypothetical protein E6J41_10585 [Chloroflexota bacterium]
MAGRGVAFRWTVALLSVVFILGAYVDAASRVVTPSPLAPWNDVFIDAAWLLVTGFMAVAFWRALTRGAAWRAALPAGYHLALIGGLVFGLGALADVYYQIAFGFGTGLEALLAPTHLVELAGGGLLVAAPLSQALKDRPERVDWPVVLSAALTLSALTFLTQYAHPLVDLWASRRWNVQITPWVAQDLGVVAIQVQVSLLVGVILLLVRSFHVPRGSLTILCGLNGLCMAIVSRHPELVWVPLLTGVAADVLLLRVRPMDSSATGLRVFAAGVPALWAVLYWVAIALVEGGSAWASAGPARSWPPRSGATAGPSATSRSARPWSRRRSMSSTTSRRWPPARSPASPASPPRGRRRGPSCAACWWTWCASWPPPGRPATPRPASSSWTTTSRRWAATR